MDKVGGGAHRRGMAPLAGVRRAQVRRGMVIHCAFCALEIESEHLPDGRRTWPDGCCWMDPTFVSVAAHRSCLRRMGERDLGLDGDAA